MNLDSPQHQPPNILWICSDQQRFDTLGCYGNPFVQTPNLDHLARHGTTFNYAFSQSPVSTPSRASFLTGRYPRTTRCRQNGQDIPPDEILITKILADQGYDCGLSGKLHLSACHPSVCSGMEPRIDDGYSQFHWSHHAGGGWETANEYWAWLEQKNVAFDTPPHPECEHIRVGMPAELHQTTWCIEKACDFIREKSHQPNPWLFSINMYDPHHHFDPPPEFLDRYLEILDQIPLPSHADGELDNKPPCQAFDHRGAYGRNVGYDYPHMTSKDHRLIRAAYWAMCDLIDQQLGRLLETLRQTGQIENTIIIYMSDHGEMLGDHGIYLKGPYFYDPAIRVPLIISWPGHIKARRSDALVELTDIAPTLLEAINRPAQPGMQGKSLWPLLTGSAPADHHRDDIYCEYYNAMPWHQNPSAQLTMLRTDQHKLVVDHGHNTGELYDLVADPVEFNNLWNDPDAISTRSDLLLQLTHRMAWTVDPLPLRRANW